MNKMILRLIAIMTFAMAGGVEDMSADSPRPDLRLELRNMRGTRMATAALEAIEARVELAAVQPASAGLRLTLVLINRGAEPVPLLDPEEWCGIVLMGEDGWPLEVPRPGPAALDDRRRDSNEPERTTKTITLAPGGEHRLTITIAQVIPRARPGEEPMEQRIRAGTYKLRVIVTLATAGDPTATRLISTGERITVHLGV